jgi:hypothetical protein
VKKRQPGSGLDLGSQAWKVEFVQTTFPEGFRLFYPLWSVKFPGGNMPRINIEDSIYKDSRFIELCIRLGSRWTAMGALFEAWLLAQKYVTIEDPLGLIPQDDWVKMGACDTLLDVRLAEKRDCKIYMCGAQRQFAWLVSTQMAGRASAVSRAKKYGTSQPNVERPSNGVRTDAERSRPSFLLPLLKNNYNKSSISNVERPEDLAARCVAAIQRFGTNKELEEYLGPEIYGKVRDAYGWQAVREMRREWILPNLVKVLKDT